MNFNLDISEFESAECEEAISAQMDAYLKEVRRWCLSGLKKLAAGGEVAGLTSAEQFGICVVARVPTIPAPHLGPKDTFTMQTVECTLFLSLDRKTLHICYVDPAHKKEPSPITTMLEIDIEDAISVMEKEQT